MKEIVERIASEVLDNLVLPGYSEKDMKDIVAFVLTVVFTIMREESLELRAGKK